MGWASGSGMCSDIIDAANEVGIDDVTRKEFYEKLIEIFENQDCDTLQECVGADPMFDEVWKTMYPDENISFEDLHGGVMGDEEE